MKCPLESRDNADVLLDYCARKLNPEMTATLERHMEVCPSCREFADAQRAVWKALDEWEAIPVSPDFNRRLYARIDREAASWWQPVLRPFRPLLAIQGLPIAAAACLVIMAGLLLERPAEAPDAGDTGTQVEAIQADQVDRALQDMELLRDFNRKVRADAAEIRM